MRALFFEWPDDHAILDFPYQYLLGDDLLVAPVVTPGVESWDVYLPAGEWIDAWRGIQFAGPDRVRVPAPLDEILVFVRVSAPASLRELFGQVRPTE